MIKKNAEFLKQIELEDLEDYGFYYTRDQPCRIQQIDYIRGDKKFKKRQDEDTVEKLRAQVVVHNVFTDQEVWNGVITEDPCTVPIVAWEEYEVVHVGHSDNECRLMEIDSEDFEEIDSIKLPTEEKPTLVKLLREAFVKSQDVGDTNVFVKVICMWGRKQIYEYEVKHAEIF